MEPNVLQMIQAEHGSFSKGQRRIARYILENYDKAAFMTAAKLGKAAEVSESTVVRFAAQLGYDGYPEMQKALQELIRGRLTSIQRIRASQEQMTSQDILGSVMQRDMESVQSAIDRLDRSAFADAVEIDDVKETLDRQIEYNMAIAEEGLKNNYGANIGKVLLRCYQPDIKITAKAYAAAASDARMNGCELPVIINSGSGNQGITASVPVIVYARGLHVSKEKLYRALCVSNLITIHLKRGIGALSAYCGVVSAGAGAACGVAYLLGGREAEINHALVNALAIDSGIICDGAKASCAAKIATAVESGLLGLNMYYNGNEFFAGEGIVKDGVENTIKSVSRLAHKGMRETDKEIIRIMLEVD